MMLLHIQQENMLVGNASVALRYPTFSYFLLNDISEVYAATRSWLLFLQRFRSTGYSGVHQNVRVVARIANEIDYEKRAVHQGFQPFSVGNHSTYGLSSAAGTFKVLKEMYDIRFSLNFRWSSPSFPSGFSYQHRGFLDHIHISLSYILWSSQTTSIMSSCSSSMLSSGFSSYLKSSLSLPVFVFPKFSHGSLVFYPLSSLRWHRLIEPFRFTVRPFVRYL